MPVQLQKVQTTRERLQCSIMKKREKVQLVMSRKYAMWTYVMHKVMGTRERERSAMLNNIVCY